MTKKESSARTTIIRDRISSSELLYKVYNVLSLITNPVLEPVRRLLNKVPALARMPVDFSPVVVLMIISLLRMIL